jgi:hypothetical protein
LRLDLSGSNNPFLRNSLSNSALPLYSPVSTGSNPPASPFDDPPPSLARPLSRNPFLDPALSINRPGSAFGNMAAVTYQASSQLASNEEQLSEASPSVEDIFASLDIQQATEPTDTLVDVSTTTTTDGLRPHGKDGHRISSQPNRPPHSSRGSNGAVRGPKPNIMGVARPPSTRRQSDGLDAPLTREEKKIILDKRKEDMKKSVPPRKHRNLDRSLDHNLDIIDKLDCTGPYIIHHDGPFDAVSSHRNGKGTRRAPMQAFPEGSLNNSLGGAGPLNARPDHATFMGNADEEAFKDYATGVSSKTFVNGKEEAVFDPHSRGVVVHGDESIGLGTSTFLQGAPAAPKAIQKAEQEKAEVMAAEGLQRKKSLAQRIRSIKKGDPYALPGRVERNYSYKTPESAPISEERNPFDEYRAGADVITVDKPTSPPSSTDPFAAPTRGLERRGTVDSLDEESKSSGIIGRMRSLRGGRRRLSDCQQPPAA